MTESHPSKEHFSSKPKLYPPNIYTIFGLFLGVETILFMSWMNAKFLPNAEKHKSTIKKFALIFLGLLIVYFLALGWATANIELNFAKSVAQKASNIYLILNVILLIFVVKYTNKDEAKFFTESFKEKTIEGKSAVLPLVLGIGFMVLIYMGGDLLIAQIAKIFLKY